VLVLKKKQVQSKFWNLFGIVSYISSLRLVEIIKNEEARSLCRLKHVAFLVNLKGKLDNLAFFFILGPLVFNQPTSYNCYTDALCEMIRSIEISQCSTPQSQPISEEDYDFFLDISRMLKNICVDVSMDEDIMNIS